MFAAVPSSRRFAAALVALIGVATALRCVNLTAPWGADNLGTAGAFFSIAARNYLAYGYRATGSVPVVTAEGPPSPLEFYTNHPPLVPLAVSASFALFGEHEWAARLVPLVASLASLVLLTYLAARFYGRRVALLTLAVATTLPLDAHLAAHVDVQGSVLLAVVLATIVALAAERYGLAIAGLTVGALVDWPALYLPVLLVLAPWPFAHPRPRRFVLGLVAYAVVLFVAIASWLSGPGAVVALLRDRAFSFRADDGRLFDLAGWLRLVVGTYLATLCTPVVLLVVLAWLLARVPAIVRRPHPDRLALFLLLFGTTHMIVGFQGAYQHEFWAHYLRAGVPLVCALAIDRLWSRLATGSARIALVACVVVAIVVPGLVGTLGLDAQPLSARTRDAGYTPQGLARAIRDCTPEGTGALTSDWYGESATFYYARRPLAVAVLDVKALDDRLRAPRWDVPGGDGTSYAVGSTVPACFVMPRDHEGFFPALAARLRAEFPVRRDGPFEIFDLRSRAPRPQPPG
jgi:4-amino-4-deoxy-L-arabinose transferase-like glycosyltransferase